MTRLIGFHRLLVMGLVAVAAALSLTQVAHAGPPAPDVPPEIRVDEGNKVFLIGHAVGVQIYTCNGSTWSSAVPRANLYNDHGKLIITHFRGPTWQAKDGSQAVGTVVNKVSRKVEKASKAIGRLTQDGFDDVAEPLIKLK